MVAREQFVTELNKLKSKIIELAHGTEKILIDSVTALYNADIALAKQAIEFDKELDKIDVAINEAAILLIAKQQPVASDLRRLIVAIRLSSDLERMADNAKNIARSTVLLGKNHGIDIPNDLNEMKKIAIEMIELSIKAYEYEDITLARKLENLDDKIDGMYSAMLRELLEETATNPEKIQHIMQMAFSGRYIERFGDHATNIGENIMYLVKGGSFDLNN